ATPFSFRTSYRYLAGVFRCRRGSELSSFRCSLHALLRHRQPLTRARALKLRRRPIPVTAPWLITSAKQELKFAVTSATATELLLCLKGLAPLLEASVIPSSEIPVCVQTARSPSTREWTRHSLMAGCGLRQPTSIPAFRK